jgi:valyl-tRNA synthetase
MSLSKNFSPAEAEAYWYEVWQQKGYFKGQIVAGKKPYTVVIPPPNVTGVLHMGHMLNNTIQDVLIRKKRMEGIPTCWVPGTDHASIATEAKVVAMLKEKGIDKQDIGREKFLMHAMEWKEKYGGIILQQLKKLGASCDWDRTTFTMDPPYYDAVLSVFVELYNKGLIYRGVRMVNWDPQGMTAISDDEVIYKEVQSKLYYVQYTLADGSGHLTVATTRPETIPGDTALCVHPEDERYKALIGKKVVVPISGRVVPVIADTYIDPAFGTGVLKVTPAHDINDYEIGQRHALEIVDTLHPDGTLSSAAGTYAGLDRFEGRKRIAKDLEASGQLAKVEDIKNKVGTSERTGAVVEPRLSMQWFVKMQPLAIPALQAVNTGEVKLLPDKFVSTYRYWMENVRDWCISRQLWWGHRIPAFYAPDGSFVVCKSATEAVALFKERGLEVTTDTIRQDEDVLDTWFSSWLWPIAVFDPGVFSQPAAERKPNQELDYFYPTSDLVTAPEILFFWVARMIMAGQTFLGEKPFEHVYLHGIVRDKQGRKMSKSLGNSPDPLDLIAQYGADGVRVGMLLAAPAGNDLLFDEKLCEQGRNFYNKIWNAYRLIHSWRVDPTLPFAHTHACTWFENRLNHQLEKLEDEFNKYRISDALMTVYKLIWDDFCSWYLEMIKPGFEAPADLVTYERTLHYFEQLLKIVHPFMPFVSEALWAELKERGDSDHLIIAAWPKSQKIDNALLDAADIAFEAIIQVRAIRNQLQKSPKESLRLYVFTEHQSLLEPFVPYLHKLAQLEEVVFNGEKPKLSTTFSIRSIEFAVPMDAQFDKKAEQARLMQELAYTKGFLESVLQKLNNERFVQNAKPEVIQNERKKYSDAQSKIESIQSQLAQLTELTT